MAYKVGIDTGGTFTDIVLFNDESKEVVMTKVPSTPKNPAEGIINGIQKITERKGITFGDIELLIHGTTVATNAILENKGAKTALLVTEGFKDVLGIRRQDRPMMYDFFAQKPTALIPRRLRYEISERISYDGNILKPLNADQVKDVVIQLKKENVQAVAICLLHSYTNPQHEIQLKEMLEKELPEDVKISISYEIVPEIREYERMSTTILNSYVHPVMERYLSYLDKELKLKGFTEEIHVMQSNGGIMSREKAAAQCINTAVSGPAAGVVGSTYLSKLAGSENVITVDMGGTSFDICLAYKNKISLTKQTEIGGHAIKVPMIDIHTIGAGGGSIGWIDEGGALRVGPQSAGATPGPACYNKGGQEPTVTDANLLLGRIDPDFYLGGEMKVDKSLSFNAIKTKIADPLGISVEAAAEGIIRVVNAGMEKGIRYVSVEKGYDPREFAMVSFGGAGSLHALEMAENLDIAKVIVPLMPGVNSAWGLLMSDFRHDFTRTYMKKASEIDFEDINKQFNERIVEAGNMIRSEGVPDECVSFYKQADIAYYGQGYELTIPFPAGDINEKNFADVTNAFHKAHEDAYGYCLPDSEIAIVNIGVSAIGALPRPELIRYPIEKGDGKQAIKAIRKVYLHGEYRDVTIYDRYLLKSGDEFLGPCIIEQNDTTTLVWPEQRCEVDTYLNLAIYTNLERSED